MPLAALARRPWAHNGTTNMATTRASRPPKPQRKAYPRTAKPAHCGTNARLLRLRVCRSPPSNFKPATRIYAFKHCIDHRKHGAAAELITENVILSEVPCMPLAPLPAKGVAERVWFPTLRMPAW